MRVLSAAAPTPTDNNDVTKLVLGWTSESDSPKRGSVPSVRSSVVRGGSQMHGGGRGRGQDGGVGAHRYVWPACQFGGEAEQRSASRDG